jgi:hypothetical protein
MLQLTVEDLVFTKPIDWEYEREWRIIKRFADETILLNYEGQPQLDELNEAIHLFPFPTDALECLIIGSRASAILRESLFELMLSDAYSHVNVLQARESERYYELEFDPVERSSDKTKGNTA